MGGHDVESGPFAVEVKSRSAFAGSGFMEQAVKNCPDGKIPLVVVHITGNPVPVRAEGFIKASQFHALFRLWRIKKWKRREKSRSNS